MSSPIKIRFASLTHEGHHCDNVPLGIAMVASYAVKRFGDKIDARIFKSPNSLMKSIEESMPDVVCFSSYTWNFRISYEIVRRIKEKSPGTVAVFGGPNFPLVTDEQERYLRTHPLIDFFVFREGEYAFAELLNVLIDQDFDLNSISAGRIEVPNTYYVAENNLVVGSSMPPILDLDEIPSPYLAGMCDEFLADPKIVPLLQFARGCPFKCNFCQEGESYFNKVRRFSGERVEQELRYVAARTKCPNLQVADSNFGMYKGDLEICRQVAAIQKEFNWPDYLVNFAGKNQKDRVLEAVRTISGSHFLSASVQSTDAAVLKAVERENVSLDQMIHVAREGADLNASSFAEIILALPEDTKAAHIKSMADMIEAEINVVRSHQFLMLKGSSICSDANKAKYRMESRYRVMPQTVVPYEFFGETFFAPEIDEICVASQTLSYEDYLFCRQFNLTVEIFYNNGIFAELYKFLQLRDISISKLIEDIHAYIFENKQPLSAIYKDFLVETEELWRTEEELAELFTHSDFIQDYLDGRAGNNEQHIYRTRAVFTCMEAIHEIAFEVARQSLMEAGLLDDQSNLYISELKNYSLLRKDDLLSLDKVEQQRFHFDFAALSDIRFENDPFNFHRPHGLDIVVKHSDDQKTLIKKYIDLYGTTEKGLGYILSAMSNFNNFYRQVEGVEQSEHSNVA